MSKMRDSAVSNANNKTSSDICDMTRSCDNISTFKRLPTNNVHIYDDTSGSSFAIVLTKPRSGQNQRAAGKTPPAAAAADWQLADHAGAGSWQRSYCSEFNISVCPGRGGSSSASTYLKSPQKKMANVSSVKPKSASDSFHSNLIDFNTPPSSPLRSIRCSADASKPPPPTYYYPGPGLENLSLSCFVRQRPQIVGSCSINRSP